MENSTIQINEGYKPALIGSIVKLHADFYSKLVNFGAPFERKVATEMSEFIGRVESPKNQTWFAELNGEIIAGITVDGETLPETQALLRWFIVGEKAKGSGVGSRLLSRAMAFCETQNFSEIHLWTFEGLDAARHLYEKYGFILVESREGNSWGNLVNEQKFVHIQN